ncbi:Mss51p [Ascoidea rubescens DSM 1968]|uniref:Protein MSS51, mitochondrial n=1 Tax=Ascoidea rubescens DSM 1968 TaxID=1344418 RepID=A0A1D2VL51_9ASCO|nr:protein MSS51, mitochondrial [Ascoidea rubescens DSM 1968]ODV62323.1 protein MSS51, mitochondrial [Ascoidea rubescens DSM 1968]
MAACFASAVRFANNIVRNNPQVRNIASFFRNALGLDPPASPDDPTTENRFHPWDSSPSAELRTRAATIKANAKCPVSHKDIQYTCPISGIPTHHSKEDWENDLEYHQSKRYELLKKVNIYEHDLRSGRPFPEFEFPEEQESDMLVNFLNWDTFFYTRLFYSMDTEFNLAAATKILSYPITIASVLHEYSPYFLKPKGPLTLEGLKSIAALRYTLYPDETSTFRDRPLRIFVLGARAESQLPAHIWKQLSYLFPYVPLELHFVGPECLFDPEKNLYIQSDTPVVKRVDEDFALVHHTNFFHVYHKSQDFLPYDPYLDVFFLFHPGLGAPETNGQWDETIKGLLESKCAIFTTGYNEFDTNRDINWLLSNYNKDLDILFEKTNNIFGSTKWELNDSNPHELYQFNQQLFGFRGKRYHAIKK